MNPKNKAPMTRSEQRLAADAKAREQLMMPPRGMSVPMTAAYMGTSVDSVLRLINSGRLSLIKLPISRTGRGELRRDICDREEVDRLMTECRETRGGEQRE